MAVLNYKEITENNKEQAGEYSLEPTCFETLYSVNLEAIKTERFSACTARNKR